MCPERLDISNYKEGQVHQLVDALEEAGWMGEDLTHLGQAGKARLDAIRQSLVKSDIIAAIEAGKTELWYHPDQKESNWIRGRVILTHLTDNGLLDGCADLEELKVIQAQGIEFFQKHFAGKAVFGWRGVQDAYVPCLIGNGGMVVLDWYSLDFDFGAINPALRRK